MQKKTLPYIEDYIEILSGFVGIKGHSIPFNLARYDIQIVNSLAEQTCRGIAFTDRQALLAHKLTVKYKRQFAQHGVDVGFHEENGLFRHATRTVDRSKAISLVNDRIYIRFPYESTMIDNLRDSGKTVPGSLQFNKDERAWVSAFTEDRLLWVETLVEKYQFDLDDQLKQAIDLIKAAQAQTHAIELFRNSDGQFEISNAESSLIDYINSNVGGLGQDNLLKLVDNSSVLGYTVSKEIQQELKYCDNVKNLLLKRDLHLPLSQALSLGAIVEYATITNRWPLYVYETETSVSNGNSKIRDMLSTFFKEDEILTLNSKQKKVDTSGHKCVYLTSWTASWNLHLPLLVSMNALMVGPKKQHILQYSDKVVYCTEFVYNPTNT